MNLYLFGSPRLERDGAPVEVDTRKAVALLAFLAVSGQQHRRDTLAGLLWPDYGQENARAALRRTLSVLKKALAGLGLLVSGDEIGLDPEAGLSIDTLRFERMLADIQRSTEKQAALPDGEASALENAAALVRGDFMAGFSLRDSPNFDDWQSVTAEGYRQKLAWVLERLTLAYQKQNLTEQGIRAARQWLALDELNETAHRRLMRLYEESGRHSDAVRQYHECARILDEELGVAPLRETTALYQEILENRLRPSPAAPEKSPSRPAPVPTPHIAGPGLVGRGEEWERLLAAYRSAGQSGFFIGLQGEAGIGKTRLAEEFLNFARGQGARVAGLRSFEGEREMAYAPLIEGLRQVCASAERVGSLAGVGPVWLAEAARLQPALLAHFLNLPPVPGLDGPGAKSRMFEALRQVFTTTLAGDQPGILFWDDLHWADAASLDWLAYLVRRLKETRLLVLATWRTGEPGADQPMSMMAGSVREKFGELLRLGPLTRASIQALVESSGRDPSPQNAQDQGLVDRLVRETEGNPFLLNEYLRLLPTRAGENETWPIPPGVRDLLHSRLRPVDETGWQILTSAAVIGRSFDFDTLLQTSGRTEEEVLDGMESLARLELIREDPAVGEVHYNFTHENLRELVYEETSGVRRRLLHGRVGEALAGRPGNRRRSGPAAAGIAAHFHLAGKEDLAGEYYRLAGDHARAVFANRDALRNYQTALSLGWQPAADLLEAAGDLLTLEGDYAKATHNYQKAIETQPAPATIAQLLVKIGEIHHRLGSWDAAEDHFQAAAQAAGENPPAAEKAHLLTVWARTANQRGDPRRARELAGAALGLAQGNPRVQILVHNVFGMIARRQEDLPLALEHLETSLGLARASGDLLACTAALNNLALLHSDTGDVPQAIVLEEEALGICVQIGDRHREAAVLNNLADLYHRSAQAEPAMQRLKQAVAIFAEIGGQGNEMQPGVWGMTEW